MASDEVWKQVQSGDVPTTEDNDKTVTTPLRSDSVALKDVTDQPGYERPDGA